MRCTKVRPIALSVTTLPTLQSDNEDNHSQRFKYSSWEIPPLYSWKTKDDVSRYNVVVNISQSCN